MKMKEQNLQSHYLHKHGGASIATCLPAGTVVMKVETKESEFIILLPV